jgi:hypothetical protein
MSNRQDNDQSDEAFVHELERRLAAEVDQLPADVSARLQEMRRQASVAADVPAPRRRLWWSAALAGAGAVALAVGVSLTGTSTEVPPLPQATDLELAASADLELLEELEFLAWLDEEDLSAG